jgi:hypothetical protein
VNTNLEGLSLQPIRNPPAGEAYPTNSWYDEDTNVSLIALPIKEYTFELGWTARMLRPTAESKREKPKKKLSTGGPHGIIVTI